MAQLDQPAHVPPSTSPPKRPRGILKNRSSSTAVTTSTPPASTETTSPTRPSAPRELSERDIVLANTLHNAGARRSTSRRQSGVSHRGSEAGDRSPRLQWDEANLYLAEQEREAMGARMKIDEPKTPFAGGYDPAADEREVGIDPEGLVVDEVEKKARDGDIPDLDIGGPEMDIEQDVAEEKRVIVEPGTAEKRVEEGDEVEKHKRFEEARKKHYEMKSVKDLLGHPEAIGDVYDDEDDEMDSPPPPPVPKPKDAVNGQ